jgi:hypothetical protein
MSEHYIHKDVTVTIDKVIELSAESGMRKVNASRASKLFKQ